MKTKKRESPKPKLGIWWDNGRLLVVIAHNPDNQTAVQAGILDSELTHAEEWPKIAGQLGSSPEDDYFVVPRGSVLHEERTGRAIIYHGNTTSQEQLASIAKAFELTDWISRLDVHYSTGDELDALFD